MFSVIPPKPIAYDWKPLVRALSECSPRLHIRMFLSQGFS